MSVNLRHFVYFSDTPIDDHDLPLSLQNLASRTQVLATSDLSPEISRRKSLICAPLLGLGLGLLLSPAPADARPNREEGRGDARKELKVYREKAMGGIEEAIDAAEDDAGKFADQVQDFVEQQKAVAAKEVEVVDRAESISLEGGVKNVKEAVNVVAEQVSEAAQEVVKSIDTPDVVQSGVKKIQAVVDKVPKIVTNTVEKVIEVPAVIVEKNGSIVDGKPSGFRVANSDVPLSERKLSLQDGLKRIGELRGK